jgi:sugar O-acyltransferase (sialic acid O-acetyltransferase NeuD family)
MGSIAKPVAVIGYSGHAFVVIDMLRLAGRQVTAYCDQEAKTFDPFGLTYLGTEPQALETLKSFDYFPAVGDNRIREKIYVYLHNELMRPPVNAIHPSAILAGSVDIGNGVLIGARTVVNPVAALGNGVICNTGSIIEHECQVADFVHIAPGAVLCGNVKVGRSSFIGANSVIRQGISIGTNVVIGAGSVVTKDIPDNTTVVGNPAR